MDTLAYVAFLGPRLLARGTRAEVGEIMLAKPATAVPGAVLVFEVESGRQVELDLHGLVAGGENEGTRGRGRPKLGVVSREVTLLPRHWDFLEAQENGASAALRRLVEAAMKKAPGEERARLIRAGLGRFLSAMAGDRPGFEEATRALYAGDTPRFEALTAKWPKDVRAFAVERAREAAWAADRL